MELIALQENTLFLLFAGFIAGIIVRDLFEWFFKWTYS